MIRHVVSVSGGKDSAATLLMALARFGRERVTPIFCDTGNEHEEVHAYLSYLEQALNIQIVRLSANFDREIAAKRIFISRDARTRREYDTAPVFDLQGNPVPKRDGRGNIVTRTVHRNGEQIVEPAQKTRKVGSGRRVRWTNKAKRRALSVLYPTGIPFLNRRHAKKFERIAPSLYAYRPLVEWSAGQVFAYCDSFGILPNPLYKQGMGRVGCMPCINCAKDEIRQIHARFPAYLCQKESWERLVGMASKRGFSTFFNKELHQQDYSDRRVHHANMIASVIQWALTTRGGRQYDLLAIAEEPTACSSAYGLCE